MADVLVNYSVDVQPGEWAVISIGVPGVPLADACVESVLEAGGNPTVVLGSSAIHETMLRNASDEQLSFVPPIARMVIQEADVMINLLAPENTRALAGIDPARLALENKAQEGLTATFMERWQTGKMRWTGAQYPTQAAAQDANMSLRDYESFVYDACRLNEPDPVAAWNRQREEQQKVIDWLRDKQTLRVAGPGTDLSVSFGGRQWINDDGHANFPGGEIFTSPVEDSANGVVQFSYPAYMAGQEVPGVRLVFEDGKVVEATASDNEPFLREMLDLDEGARRLGELAIGMNPGVQRFSKNTLFDEKIAGTMHMALGQGFQDAGGANTSSLHWDMVYDLRNGSEITVDGVMLSRSGEVSL